MKKPLYCRPYPPIEIKKLMQWLFDPSLAGINRACIIKILNEQPRNAYEITIQLNLHISTVRYHLEVLMKNELVLSTSQKHGRLYYLSPFLEKNIIEFDEIFEQLDQFPMNNNKRFFLKNNKPHIANRSIDRTFLA